jgi:type VI secretion system secreted protein VgrG
MNILIHPAQFPIQQVTYQVLTQDGAVRPFCYFRIKTREGKVYEGTTNVDGHTQRVSTRYPDALTIEFPFSLPLDTQEPQI